jgi:hypothetical protein
MEMLGEFPHETEVGPHSVAETSHLTQFRNEKRVAHFTSVDIFLSGSADEKGLIHIRDFDLVAVHVVFREGDLLASVVEGVLRVLRVVNIVNVVGLAVVLSHHDGILQLSLHCVFLVSTAILLSLANHVENGVHPEYLVGDLYTKHHFLFLLAECGDVSLGQNTKTKKLVKTRIRKDLPHERKE